MFVTKKYLDKKCAENLERMRAKIEFTRTELKAAFDDWSNDVNDRIRQLEKDVNGKLDAEHQLSQEAYTQRFEDLKAKVNKVGDENKEWRDGWTASHKEHDKLLMTFAKGIHDSLVGKNNGCQ